MVAWVITMVVECVEEILNLMTDKQTGRKEGELGGRGQGQDTCPGLTPCPHLLKFSPALKIMPAAGRRTVGYGLPELAPASF